MRILFISYLTQPSDRIGAVRPSNMARWLAEFGHSVTLLTANREAPGANGGADVRVVEHSRLIGLEMKKLEDRARARRKAGVKPHGYIAPASGGKRKVFTKETFYSLRLFVWRWLCQQDWAAQCRRYIRRNLSRDYDVILSSFGPLGCLLAGRWARRHGYGRVWVSDMRDPIANSMQTAMEYRYSIALERSTLRTADGIVTVSEGEAEHFRALSADETQRRKVSYLENGFETGHVQDRSPADGILRIVYTGQLYGNRSDAAALLKAVCRLEREAPESKGTVQVHYAGPHSYDFLETARRCGAEAAVVDHGMLPRQQALSLQEQADILCVLSWNDDQSRGHLPGKFWEYLRLGKPILAIISGSAPDAELSLRVRDMKAGFAYEYVREDTDGPALYAWLLEAWRHKSSGEAVPFCPDQEKILDYRYDNRTRHMERLCQTILEKNGE